MQAAVFGLPCSHSLSQGKPVSLGGCVPQSDWVHLTRACLSSLLSEEEVISGSFCSVGTVETEIQKQTGKHPMFLKFRISTGTALGSLRGFRPRLLAAPE